MAREVLAVVATSDDRRLTLTTHTCSEEKESISAPPADRLADAILGEAGRTVCVKAALMHQCSGHTSTDQECG